MSSEQPVFSLRARALKIILSLKIKSSSSLSNQLLIVNLTFHNNRGTPTVHQVTSTIKFHAGCPGNYHPKRLDKEWRHSGRRVESTPTMSEPCPNHRWNQDKERMLVLASQMESKPGTQLKHRNPVKRKRPLPLLENDLDPIKTNPTIFLRSITHPFISFHM